MSKNNVRHIRAYYTVKQLAEIFGASPRETLKTLYRLGVPCTYVGRRNIFFLSDIRTHLPILFTSIMEANQLNQYIENETIEDLSDNESFTASQFRSSEEKF